MHNFSQLCKVTPSTPHYRIQTAKLNISAKRAKRNPEKPSHVLETVTDWGFLLLGKRTFSGVQKLLFKEDFGSWVAKKLQLSTQLWPNFVN